MAHAQRLSHTPAAHPAKKASPTLRSAPPSFAAHSCTTIPVPADQLGLLGAAESVGVHVVSAW